MSRVIWFAAGAGAGVYAMNKARQFARTLTADGMRARWNGVTHGARLLAQDAKQAQVNREDELRAKLGLPAVHPSSDRQLTAAGSANTLHTPVLNTAHENDEKDTY